MARAIIYDHFGGPDVLRLAEFATPTPGPGQVCLEVRAAGVNPVDAKLRRGDLAHIFTPQFPVIPGIEVSGIVSEVGEGVTAFEVGDTVFGVADAGGYADYALATQIATKPVSIAWELAASLSIVGEAAFRTLGHLEVEPGDRLLILGGSGSVGTVAVQLATAIGATVIATTGPQDRASTERLGAVAIDYGEGWVDRVRETAPNGVDAVLDTTGAGLLPDAIQLAGGPERVVTIADEAAFALGVRFTGPDPADRDWAALGKLADLVEKGQLVLPIWKTYPLTQAINAHADLDEHRYRGKIVLIP